MNPVTPAPHTEHRTPSGVGQTERTSVAGTPQHNTTLGLSRQGTTSWTRDPHGTLISQRASGGVRHYYLSDALGSVAGLTDSTGALTRTYKYDPYGQIRSTTGTTPNPFQYTGEYRESQGELYKIGARYYRPALGRWTQIDPLDQAGDLREGNRYVYAASDPINFTDPTGEAVPAILVAIGVRVLGNPKTRQWVLSDGLRKASELGGKVLDKIF